MADCLCCLTEPIGCYTYHQEVVRYIYNNHWSYREGSHFLEIRQPINDNPGMFFAPPNYIGI